MVDNADVHAQEDRLLVALSEAQLRQALAGAAPGRGGF
jgi:hypothetical protein